MASLEDEHKHKPVAAACRGGHGMRPFAYHRLSAAIGRAISPNRPAPNPAIGGFSSPERSAPNQSLALPPDAGPAAAASPSAAISWFYYLSLLLPLYCRELRATMEDATAVAKDGSGVKSQEDEDVVAAEQGGDDDICVRYGGNVMEQCTSDQQRRTTDDDAAEVVEQEGGVLQAVADKVDKVLEQDTSDQPRTSTDGFSAGYPQRPGELDCLCYLLRGWCSDGSSCDFNHPQFSGDQLLTDTDDTAAQGQDVVKHGRERPVKQENMEQRLRNLFAEHPHKEDILENLLDSEPSTEDGRFVSRGDRRIQLLNISLSANFKVEQICVCDSFRGQLVYYYRDHNMVGQNLVLTGPERPIDADDPGAIVAFPFDRPDSMTYEWDLWEHDDYYVPSMRELKFGGTDREVNVTYLRIPYAVDVEVKLGLISIPRLNGYREDGWILGTVKAWTRDYGEHHVSLFTGGRRRTKLPRKLSCDKWISLLLLPSVICLPNRRNLQLTIEVDLMVKYRANKYSVASNLKSRGSETQSVHKANKYRVVSNLTFRGSETQSVLVNDHLLSVGVTMRPEPDPRGTVVFTDSEEVRIVDEIQVAMEEEESESSSEA